MSEDRPYYNRALRADRPVLGMSHGPFSGVNEVLGIVSELETRLNAILRGKPKSGAAGQGGEL